jgi:hypothetical protein
MLLCQARRLCGPAQTRIYLFIVQSPAPRHPPAAWCYGVGWVLSHHPTTEAPPPDPDFFILYKPGYSRGLAPAATPPPVPSRRRHAAPP